MKQRAIVWTIGLCIIATMFTGGYIMADQVFNENIDINGQLRVTGGARVAILQGSNTFMSVKVNDPNKSALNIQNAAATSVIQNNVNGSGGGSLRISSGAGVNNVLLDGDDKAFIRNINFGINTNSPSFPLHVVGDAKVQGTTSTNVLEITGGADLAEHFPVAAGSTEPGMVMCIDAANPGALMVSSKSYDRTVAGIVSGAGGLNPGMLMGQQGTIASGDHPLALSGRVYVKADATSAPIVPGDLLTTSDIAGHAMKATDFTRAHGAIIGKAMSGLDSGTGMILVLVSLQ